MNKKIWTFLKELVPTEPRDIILVTLHLFIVGYAIFTELHILDKTAFTLSLFIILFNLSWTFSLILFMFKLADKVERNFAVKQREIDAQNASLDKLKKNARYADVLNIVNMAFGEVHQIMRQISLNGDPHKNLSIDLTGLDRHALEVISEELKRNIININEALGKLCDHTEDAFKKLTGDDSVAVCIKIISGDLEGDLASCHAETIVRGRPTLYSRGLKPQYKTDGTLLVHKLTKAENTSFSSIIDSIRNKDPHAFFCNALPLLAKMLQILQ